MKHQEAFDYVTILPREVPIFFLGPPGMGKSEGARTIAASDGPDAVVSRWELTGHGPEDIVGVPFPIDGMTQFLPPERLVRLSGDVVGTLILEDITQASKAVQCACFQLVQERSIGPFKLSPNVRIILTGNRANDKAGARELPSPLRNRVMLVTLEPDLEEWMYWAASKGYPAVVGSFLTYKSGYFAQTPDKGCKENGQFATPRAWENVCRVYEPSVAFGKGDIGPLQEACGGLVGEGVAAEFCAFVKLQKELPNPKAVLDNPEKALPNPPAEADRLHAMVTALGEYAALNQGKDKKIYLKLLLALPHVSKKGGREGCAAGVSVFQANGGDVNALCAAAEQNKKDPRVLSVLKFFAASVK
jgi:hypothetical protein